jgi:ComF family protein
MAGVADIRDALMHLMFPHVCLGCGSDLPEKNMVLCLRCIHDLPETNFENFAANPVEKIFWGRLNLESAFARYYFTKGSLIQRLMHLFKYRGELTLGKLLGRFMGEAIKQDQRFPVDAFLPLPLYEKRERSRGYNQSLVLCEGMAEITNLPVIKDAVIRPAFTETQTKKGRVERWKNIEGRFRVVNPTVLENRHLLLIDDVVTTGATLESCGAELLKIDGVKLSIGTLCYSFH